MTRAQARTTIAAVLVVLALLLGSQAAAQPVTFKDVKIRLNRGDKDRRLVDKSVDLVFDDSAKQLTVKGYEKPVTISYDDVEKAVFDVTTHMRGGAVGQLLVASGSVAGGVAGIIVEAKHVNDYWFYIGQKSGRYTVLEIPKELSPQVIDKAKATFGDRVSEYPTQQGEKIEKETLKDLQSKHSLKGDKKQHPIPEIKPDKALVVVVCPPLAARTSGKGIQYKLHANDKVVAVNKQGTYSFAYLDPGDYLLVAQSENASGLKVKLDAGKDYYFLQNTFMGVWKMRTSLSQQSREIVLHELSGAKYADWERK